MADTRTHLATLSIVTQPNGRFAVLRELNGEWDMLDYDCADMKEASSVCREEAKRMGAEAGFTHFAVDG